MMKLRPYQAEARDATLREWSAGNRKTLLVLPTGTGKTVIFSSVAHEEVKRGGRVLIQSNSWRLPYGFNAAAYRPKGA